MGLSRFISMWRGVVFFMFRTLGIHWAPWICGFTVFNKGGDFSVLISSNNLSVAVSSPASLLGTPVILVSAAWSCLTVHGLSFPLSLPPFFSFSSWCFTLDRFCVFKFMNLSFCSVSSVLITSSVCFVSYFSFLEIWRCSFFNIFCLFLIWGQQNTVIIITLKNTLFC